MQDAPLNIDRCLRILSERKWLVIISVVSISASSFIFSLLEKPVYLTKAVIEIKPQIIQGVSAFKDITIAQEMEELRNLTKSKELLYRLEDEVYKRSALLTSPEYIQQMLSDIRGDFEVEGIEDTNLVELKVRGENPKELAIFANTIAQAYVDLTLKEKLEKAKRLRSILEEQSDIHGTRLKEVEKGLLGTEQDFEALEKEKLLLTKRLSELQIEYLGLKQAYSTQNPRINELKAHIKAMQERLKGLIKQESESLSLHRELKIETQEYKDYLLRAFDVRVQENLQMPDVKIVEWAVEPYIPVSPDKVRNVAIGALIGLIIGLAVIFFIEHISTSLRTAESIEDYVKLPAMGIIPYLGTNDKKKLIFNYPADSQEAECYRYLRTNILSKASGRAKSFLITSAGAGEGKSITAANVAIMMSEAGKKTLLVDADLRRPAIHRLFDISMHPGLTDILLDPSFKCMRKVYPLGLQDLESEEIIKNLSNIKHLFILSCGNLPENPAELLDSAGMRLFIEKVMSNFDIILFDSPPVLPFADARILGSRLDATLLLYRVGITDRGALLRAKVEMEQAGSSIPGIIVNNLNPLKRWT